MAEIVFISLSLLAFIFLAIPQLLWIIEDNKEIKIYTEKKEK
tara:strand:- start:114 stop:239 length:126 start_codon:yes stop_codon:yes gene_type:complete